MAPYETQLPVALLLCEVTQPSVLAGACVIAHIYVDHIGLGPD